MEVWDTMLKDLQAGTEAGNGRQGAGRGRRIPVACQRGWCRGRGWHAGWGWSWDGAGRLLGMLWLSGKHQSAPHVPGWHQLLGWWKQQARAGGRTHAEAEKATPDRLPPICRLQGLRQG